MWGAEPGPQGGRAGWRGSRDLPPRASTCHVPGLANVPAAPHIPEGHAVPLPDVQARTLRLGEGQRRGRAWPCRADVLAHSQRARERAPRSPRLSTAPCAARTPARGGRDHHPV